jgi:hypothetical protein
MKDLLEKKTEAEQRQVDVVHILNDGKAIMAGKELEPFAERFLWIENSEIANLIQELKPQTDPNRKSIIVVFENKEIKTYPNISKNFNQYSLLSKAGL